MRNCTGFWNHRYNVVIFEFDSSTNAKRWLSSQPEIRQYDFLDGIDVILVAGNSEIGMAHFYGYSQQSLHYFSLVLIFDIDLA